jgi:hypothetical protein
MNGDGTCSAADNPTDWSRVLGRSLEIPSGNTGMALIGNMGLGRGTKNTVPVTVDGTQRMKVACCAIDLASGALDASFPALNIDSFYVGSDCGWSNIAGGTITVNFSAGLFSDVPRVFASVMNTPYGLVPFCHTGGSAWTHIMLKKRETIVPASMNGTLLVHAVGKGA